MPLLSPQPAVERTRVDCAIMHDLTDINDLDEFLAADEAETCTLMVSNAGCFY